MLSNSTFEFAFSCHCGWFEEDHYFLKTGDEFSKRSSRSRTSITEWSPEDIKALPTNAYGVVKFHGAGEGRAKVQCIWVAYNITY